MKSICLLPLLFSLVSAAQLQKLKPGQIKPGFISVTRFDLSRQPVKEQPIADNGRLVQINIWYPSAGNAKRMNFGEYVRLAGFELDSANNSNALQSGIEKYFAWPASLGAAKEKFIGFLDKKKSMLAGSHAKWKKTTYPLVLLVHGFAADHAYLAEWLASYGYIVVQVPVKGSTTFDLDYEGAGLESQVKDYEFAVKIIRDEYAVQTSTMAVAGFSFGGQSAVALALRNPAIKAIVSLDGGVGSAFGSQLLSKQSYYDEKKISQPILHLYNAGDTHTDLGWFNRITNCDRYLVAMKDMQHGHFTSFGLLNRVVPGIMGKGVADPGRGYEAVMLMTKGFLDQYLKNEMTLTRKNFMSLQETYPWIRDSILKTQIKTSGS